MSSINEIYINEVEIRCLPSGKLAPREQQKALHELITRHVWTSWDETELDDGDVNEIEELLLRLSKRYPDIYFEYCANNKATSLDEGQTYTWICRGQRIEKYPQVIVPELSPEQLLDQVKTAELRGTTVCPDCNLRHQPEWCNPGCRNWGSR